MKQTFIEESSEPWAEGRRQGRKGQQQDVMCGTVASLTSHFIL